MVRVPLSTTNEKYDFRTYERWSNGGIVISVYCSNYTLAETLCDEYSDKILRIRTPMNEQHELTLGDTNVVVRQKLFYGKYKFKVDTFRDWKQTSTLDWNNTSKEIIDWVDTHFDNNSRLRSQDYYYGLYHTEKSPPFIYTNDEQTLMVYKLSFGSKAIINISRVVTLDELNSA